jgi:hypothetical protein
MSCHVMSCHHLVGIIFRLKTFAFVFGRTMFGEILCRFVTSRLLSKLGDCDGASVGTPVGASDFVGVSTGASVGTIMGTGDFVGASTGVCGSSSSSPTGDTVVGVWVSVKSSSSDGSLVVGSSSGSLSFSGLFEKDVEDVGSIVGAMVSSSSEVGLVVSDTVGAEVGIDTEEGLVVSDTVGAEVGIDTEEGLVVSDTVGAEVGIDTEEGLVVSDTVGAEVGIDTEVGLVVSDTVGAEVGEAVGAIGDGVGLSSCTTGSVSVSIGAEVEVYDDDDDVDVGLGEEVGGGVRCKLRRVCI